MFIQSFKGSMKNDYSNFIVFISLFFRSKNSNYSLVKKNPKENSKIKYKKVINLVEGLQVLGIINS